MQKTRIDWCDYTVNFVSGLCPVDCKDNNGKSYCYARSFYRRFKWNPEIRLNTKVVSQLKTIKEPSRIFVGSTMELFGDWIKPEWIEWIRGIVNCYPQHTFIFLTKQYQNLQKYSPFPENCWIGVSAPNAINAINANKYMAEVDASIKFISIEPMFDWAIYPEEIEKVLSNYDWIILGQRFPLNKATIPDRFRVYDLIETCHKLNKPLFVKDNILNSAKFSSLKNYHNIREFPVK